ncbi:MAG: hypothetical protein AAFY15_10720 [Cyanobacteria bacterium J06648_11]
MTTSDMGAEPYGYFVPYQPDLDAALQSLRQREFAAGRYHPVVPLPELPVTDESAAPGAQHASIAEAVAAAGVDGTRSILDIKRLAPEPISEDEIPEDFEAWIDRALGMSFPLSAAVLTEIFGTEKPSRLDVEDVLIREEMREGMADRFWDSIDRGSCRHFVVYEDDVPTELFFAGYSFD